MRVDRPMEFRVLGPIEVRNAHGLVELPKGRSRPLLAMLALRAGQTVSVDQLIDELWGLSPPSTVVTALHGLISGLRKCIEPDRRDAAPRLLVTRSPGYVLDVPPDCVDAHRFRALLQCARRVAVHERAQLLHEALELWRGPALADMVFSGASSADVAQLEELRLAALEERIDADLALGRHAAVIGDLDAQVAQHPFHERFHAQLMLALYRSGRQSEAFDVWRRARTTIVDQLGIEPGPGLRRLHEAILEQDPALDLQPTVPSEHVPAESTRDMTARAGVLLAAAGSRVYEHHYDAAIAEELFARAEQLLPPDHPQREGVDDRLSEIYLMLGRHSDADNRLKRSLGEARRRHDTKRERHLLLERARIQLILGPDPIPMTDAEAIALRALEGAEAAGDDDLTSQACYVLGLIELRRGHITRMEVLARRGLSAAERSGSPRERLAARWWLALALVEGATPTDDAIAECEELAELGTARHLGVLTELARLHAERGAHDVAGKLIDDAMTQLQRRPGMRRPAMFVAQRAGEIAAAAGGAACAEPHLRTALAIADDLGEADQRAQLAAKLALALMARGHSREAAALAHHSQRTAPLESATASALSMAAMIAVNSGAGVEGSLDDLMERIPPEMRRLKRDLSAQFAKL
jgi:DNA-binding SARP family transcriptional activator